MENKITFDYSKAVNVVREEDVYKRQSWEYPDRQSEKL